VLTYKALGFSFVIVPPVRFYYVHQWIQTI